MDNHDWKKEHRKIDAYLANKYNTKPSIVHVIRVSSIKKNLTQKEIIFSIVRKMERYKLSASHMQHYREMLEYASNLKHDDWTDITRPDTEAIGYMLEGAGLIKTKKGKSDNDK